jgi:hypothetical protein
MRYELLDCGTTTDFSYTLYQEFQYTQKLYSFMEYLHRYNYDLATSAKCPRLLSSCERTAWTLNMSFTLLNSPYTLEIIETNHDHNCYRIYCKGLKVRIYSQMIECSASNSTIWLVEAFAMGQRRSSGRLICSRIT